MMTKISNNGVLIITLQDSPGVTEGLLTGVPPLYINTHQLSDEVFSGVADFIPVR